MSSEDWENNVGCFGLFCACIAFFATWGFSIVTFNFFGLVLGWIPALIVGFVVYFASYLALFIFYVILIIILLSALFMYFS